MVKVLLVIALSIITFYFLWTTAFPKLIVTKDSYGEYYWFRAPWLFIHVFTGLIATLVGWYQFIPSFRTRNLKLHRIIGRLYICCIAIASLTAVYIALVSPGMNILGKLSFLVVSLVWLSTVVFGFLSIIKHKIIQHQEWVLRSYVVTFFFTIVVILTKYFPSEYIGVSTNEAFLFHTWISWSVPLFITELYIQFKKDF